MNLSLPYLLEVSICMGLFYLLYAIVLRRYTFFTANRFYLLLGLILSFVIPFLSIPIFKTNYSFVFESVEGLPAGYMNAFPTSPTELAQQRVFTFSNLLWIVYGLGVLVLLIKFLFSVFQIFALVRRGSHEKHEDYRIVRLTDVQPFSFGKWVFLPKGHVDPLVVAHESLHVKHFHWVDLVVVEVVKCVVWFNPVVYWYKKAMQLQHEYMADHTTLQSSDRPEDYMHAVMIQLRANTVSMPVNRFHSLSIKKRILMMTQKQTSRSRVIWYALSLPIIATLLFSFAFTSKKKGVITRPQPVIPAAISPLLPQDNVPSLFPVDISGVKTVIAYGERMHPLLKEMKMHTGLDFVVAEGSKIVATADGFVMEAGFNGAHGYYMIIKHGVTYSTRYSHMKGFAAKEGQNVKAGETVGYVGSTGLSTGPHLHYEIFEKNKQVDPAKFMPELEGC
jgi:beta-lactamase regulating signal transducer with metallopeptidase domain